MSVPITLQLYLSKDWAQGEARRAKAKVPESISFKTKGDIALTQIDIALANGVRFGTVLADAGYGSSAEFRAGLTQRGLRWAVGVQPTQKQHHHALLTMIAFSFLQHLRLASVYSGVRDRLFRSIVTAAHEMVLRG